MDVLFWSKAAVSNVLTGFSMKGEGFSRAPSPTSPGMVVVEGYRAQKEKAVKTVGLSDFF